MQVDENAEGSYDGSITVTNLTTSAGSYNLATNNAPTGCQVTPASGPTTPATATKIALKLTSQCKLQDDTAITLLLSFTDQQPNIPIIAKSDTPEAVDWALLNWAFGLAAILFGVAMTVSYRVFKKHDSSNRKLFTTLPGLSATWSFKDSWVSIATLVTAIFSGVFGSPDVVKAITGSSDVADTLVNVTVSGAIALGLVAAAPVLLLTLRAGSRASKDAGKNTAIGVVLASWLVLTATGGQLSILLWTARDISISPTGFYIALAISAALLLAYSVRSTLVTLEQGVTPVAEPKPMKVEVVPSGSGDDYPQPDYYGWGTSAGDSPAALP